MARKITLGTIGNPMENYINPCIFCSATPSGPRAARGPASSTLRKLRFPGNHLKTLRNHGFPASATGKKKEMSLQETNAFKKFKKAFAEINGNLLKNPCR